MNPKALIGIPQVIAERGRSRRYWLDLIRRGILSAVWKKDSSGRMWYYTTLEEVDKTISAEMSLKPDTQRPIVVPVSWKEHRKSLRRAG